MDASFAVIAHLLMFAYWLGGDIGAFIASRLLTNTSLSPEQRLTAARILNHVDMAPKMALIWALPSGLWLTEAHGWQDIHAGLLASLAVIALVWTAMLWRLHLAHGQSILTRIDYAIRVLVVIGLFVTGLAGLAGLWPAPVFIALKLIILGLITTLGLIVRNLVKPLGPALHELVAGVEQDRADGTILQIMGRARVCVIAIWVLLAAALYLGVFKPV